MHVRVTWSNNVIVLCVAILMTCHGTTTIERYISVFSIAGDVGHQNMKGQAKHNSRSNSVSTWGNPDFWGTGVVKLKPKWLFISLYNKNIFWKTLMIVVHCYFIANTSHKLHPCLWSLTPPLFLVWSAVKDVGHIKLRMVVLTKWAVIFVPWSYSFAETYRNDHPFDIPISSRKFVCTL